MRSKKRAGSVGNYKKQPEWSGYHQPLFRAVFLVGTSLLLYKFLCKQILPCRRVEQDQQWEQL